MKLGWKAVGRRQTVAVVAGQRQVVAEAVGAVVGIQLVGQQKLGVEEMMVLGMLGW